jgi:hypothetical protein
MVTAAASLKASFEMGWGLLKWKLPATVILPSL